MKRENRLGGYYWNQVLNETRQGAPITVWRAYMRRVYLHLIQTWLPTGSGLALKTDLFEEAVTPHYLLPDLGRGSIGMDFSPAVAQTARQQLGTAAEVYPLVVTDLRKLPLQSGSFARILSGSSLDHFHNKTDIATGLSELARILAPGGTLIVAFDNPQNPIIALRNHLPFTWLNRLHLVPYYIGATYGVAEAREKLEMLGLDVIDVTAVAHAPRAPAIWLVAMAERLHWPQMQIFIARVLDSLESLARLPTRYWTGYYIALQAKKPINLDSMTRA
jgi:ubiquinone/menaquinone biosynthesis C-methylase UbiE